MSLDTLGKKIKYAREKARLTQEELGKAFGKSKWTVIRIEQDKAEPSYAELEKIAHATGVTAVDLLDPHWPEHVSYPPKPGEGEKRTIISMDDWITVPIVSREWTACCGTGITAADITNENEGVIKVDRKIFYRLDDRRMPFAIHCDGDCLESAGIRDGYLAIINPAEEPANGAIALVSIGGSLSLKYFNAMPNGDVLLRSDRGSRRLTAEEMDRDEFAVLGVLADVHQGRPKIRPL